MIEPLNMDTERELVKRAVAQDARAFNQLIAAYRPLIYEYAKQVLGDHAAAEDATQNTIIFAWQRIHEFTYPDGAEVAKFKHWLLATCRNFNKRVQEGRVLEDSLWLKPATQSHEPFVLESPTNEMEMTELVIAIKQVLTPTQIRVFDLMSDGHTNKEISTTLGISSVVVRKHKQNIRRRVHKIVNNSD